MNVCVGDYIYILCVRVPYLYMCLCSLVNMHVHTFLCATFAVICVWTRLCEIISYQRNRTSCTAFSLGGGGGQEEQRPPEPKTGGGALWGVYDEEANRREFQVLL